MDKKALLVIDMLRDFVDRKGALYCGPEAQRIIPFIKARIDEFRKNADPVIFIMDTHQPDDPEFKLFPKHCVRGTEGAELINELKIQKEDFIVPKKTYDGVFGSNLEYDLKKNGIEEVYLAGVCTSICVMETAGSLTKLGYKVNIYKNGVADFDQEAHRFALKRMKNLFGANII